MPGRYVGSNGYYLRRDCLLAMGGRCNLEARFVLAVPFIALFYSVFPISFVLTFLPNRFMSRRIILIASFVHEDLLYPTLFLTIEDLTVVRMYIYPIHSPQPRFSF